ncbi:DHA1 family bicyclomycin/chloramphenicol resistance-like MFS transporter [Nocardiopsis sp. Huas11]|uniref:multidrug effflux MFS transporter n=1 Tax=Nocardiopsis sp. Huas11 TaxID=2183912 RepID=UPI000EB5A72A|nr:multidrug effflux MFS transporter [Nocardiopsis sp. Huas11]RKS09467.1 DHA1 family bicyclomycin/chloramphenicol resistance-like MFS transporter [Nocardiopsis sp. Huas11]
MTPQQPTGRARLGLALLLGLLSVLGPVSIDMYLPGLPAIADDLDASASVVQLSLTACMVGLAAGQVVVGPLSDARGRRGPLLVSLALFVLSSLLCALAPTAGTLVAARFLQGFTASAGLVLSRAVVRDVFSGGDLTRFFSVLTAITAVAPLIAPVIGGGILWLPLGGWRSVFVFLAVLGAAVTAVAALGLGETLPPERRVPGSVGGSLRSMGSLLRDRSFFGYALVVGLLHGGSFAYVAGTPFVYQDLHGVSAQGFGVLFAVNGLAMILGSASVGRLSDRWSERTLLRAAAVAAVASTGAVLVATLVGAPLVALAVPLFVYMAAMGATLACGFALAMHGQERRAGAASALIGAFPMVIGAVAAPLVGLDETTAVPMGAVLFGSAALALLALCTLTTAGPNARTGARSGVGDRVRRSMARGRRPRGREAR